LELFKELIEEFALVLKEGVIAELSIA